MKNKWFVGLWVLLIVGFVLTGCPTGGGGGDGIGDTTGSTGSTGGGIAREDLIGEWRGGTRSNAVLTLTDSTWSSEWDIPSDGDKLGGHVSFSDTLTWSVSGSTLTLKYLDNTDPSGTDEETFRIALSQDKQTLTVSFVNAIYDIIIPSIAKGTYTKQ
jgi:hypothetical protein